MASAPLFSPAGFLLDSSNLGHGWNLTTAEVAEPPPLVTTTTPLVRPAGTGNVMWLASTTVKPWVVMMPFFFVNSLKENVPAVTEMTPGKFSPVTVAVSTPLIVETETLEITGFGMVKTTTFFELSPTVIYIERD